MSQVQCPQCGNQVPGLQAIDDALMAKLQESGAAVASSQVCVNCFGQLAGSVARGSVLMAREKAREAHKLMLWKSRVGLIKRARAHMQDKAFSDAAVHYEKYLRVLEVVFDCKKGDLSPDHFKDSARTQELTVVASAYWDLLRIYDTSEKYGDRMAQTSSKLATFLRFTPIYPDIMRKAEAFAKNAKNQPVMKAFLKTASDAKGGCFIATSAFDSPIAPEVMHLRRFRDETLMPSRAGQWFVKNYYRFSPRVARFLDKHPACKPVVRKLLRKFIEVALGH